MKEDLTELISDAMCNIPNIDEHLASIMNETAIMNILSKKPEDISNDMVVNINSIVKILKSLYDNSSSDTLIISDDLYDKMVVFLERYDIVESGSSGTKQLKNDTKHEYPQLKGTTDKAKYVYTKDIPKNEKLVKTVEMFFDKIYKEMRYKDSKETEILASLKYDGQSVITSEYCGNVTKAITRGDDGLGGDVTSKVKNLRKYHCKYGNKIGTKNEILLPKDNLDIYNKATNNSYKNTRSAIVSIMNNPEYSDLLTLVPIDIRDNDKHYTRTERIDIIEKYLDVDICFYYMKFKGNKQLLLKFIKAFNDVVLRIRHELSFDIDGIVIEFIGDDIVNKMGRKNDVNKYEIALKFPSEEKQTLVEDFKVTVGKFGKITPMVYYTPVTFSNKSTHIKTSLGSYGKFKEMKLRYNDTMNLKYTNDVICHLTKDVESSKHTGKELIEFPMECPICGNNLSFTDNEAFCLNEDCNSRQAGRIYKFIDIFKIRDVAERTIDILFENGIILSIEDLLNIEKFKGRILQLDGFAEKSFDKIAKQIKNIRNGKINDVMFLASLGIKDMGRRNFKQICTKYSLDELLSLYQNGKLRNSLSSIYGIKEKKIDRIISFLDSKYDEVKRLKSYFNFEKGDINKDEPVLKVKITGFRDKDLVERSKKLNIDMSEGEPSKNTNVLLVKDMSVSNKKTDKAEKLGIEILTPHNFINKYIIPLEK